MPAWWNKKGWSKDSDNSAKKRGKNFDNQKVNCFHEAHAPTISRAGDSSGFDSFDKGHPHPLPRPFNDQLHGGASGSGSVSSVSSSGSSDDHAAFRGHGENKLSRGSRCSTTPVSPLHARLGGMSLDSPGGKLEEGKSEFHKLPLPPGSPSSPSALPTPRSPGTTESSSYNASKWRQGKLLGRGTFVHVYLGFNSENGQMCAIKEVRLVSDDQSSKESLKQLNQVPSTNYCKNAFTEPVIQNYTRQILSGLAYLHGFNTVHRDIKGANILVDPNGEIKLADFGMAKHIANCSSMLSFKGSPYWMAPEVVMNTNGYSLPVDIWSLGCTVLEMATSKPPWSQYEGVAAIFKIGNSKDAPEIPDHLSADAKGFLRLCLQREPSARPTAFKLLSHPFVINQTTARANVNITRAAFPRAFDGSRTPTAQEMQSSRTMNSSFDRDDALRLNVPRTYINPRDNTRMITSLPVSPSSSPLRHDGAAYNSFFLSPPHPSYPYVGQSSQNYSDHSLFPSRPNSRTSLDPWLEIPQYRAQAPFRSQTRNIL